METKIGHIYEYSDSRVRIIYIITGIKDNEYIMTKILLYHDRRSLVNDNYRLPVSKVNELIQRGSITQIHPTPPAPTIRVKFFDGNTRKNQHS